MSEPAMRILMLLGDGFHPDPRPLKEATSLQKIGFKTTLIALDRDQNLPEASEIDGIEVRRIRVGPVRAGSPLSLSRALPLFQAKSVRLARQLHGERPFCLVHCHDFDTMPAGIVLRRLLSIPLVYDLHDLYAGFFASKALQQLTNRIDRLFFRASDCVIITNDTYSPHVGGKTRVAQLMNVPKRDGGHASSDTDSGLFYAGNLDILRDMRYAVECLAESGIPVTFAGAGPLLEDYRRIDPEGRIRLLGWIPPAEVMEHTRRCLAILALYDVGVENNRILAPNKIFEGFKYGKPAIVSSGTAMADIVLKTGAGLAVEYGSAADLRASLERLRDPAEYARLSENAFSAFESTYNWQSMEPQLFSLYRSLTGLGQHPQGHR